MGAADPDQLLTLLFAVRHTPAQLDALEAAARRISEPDSHAFRQYLSYEQTQQQFTPPSESIDTVVAFINEQLGLKPQTGAAADGAASNSNSNGVRVSVLPGGWVRAEGVKVVDAANMLHTEFSLFENVIKSSEADQQRQQEPSDIASESLPAESQQPPSRPSDSDSQEEPSVPLAGVPMDHSSSLPVVRSSTGYSLPADVAALVDFVDGVTKLPTARFQAVVSRATANDVPYSPPPITTINERMGEPTSWPRTDLLYTVTPSFLRDLYNIPATARGSLSRANRQVVPQFLEQYYSESDLQAYLTRHGVEPAQNVSKVHGPNVPHTPGGEASLDTQLIMSLAPGVLTEVWSFAGRRDNSQPPSNFNQEPFLDWLLHLAADPAPPLVHSISYADDEKDCTEVRTLSIAQLWRSSEPPRGLTIS